MNVSRQLPQTAFEDPALDSQSVFRSLLTAMSSPGEVVDLAVGFDAPAPLSPACALVLLTLADLETPVWLDAAADTPQVRQWLRYACSCPLAGDVEQAAFAVITDLGKAPRLSAFNRGTDEYPDRSTTLIVQVEALHSERGAMLEGPGIESPRKLAFEPCPEWFWAEAIENHGLYPRGVDLLFCSERSVASLPRSSRPREL